MRAANSYGAGFGKGRENRVSGWHAVSAAGVAAGRNHDAGVAEESRRTGGGRGDGGGHATTGIPELERVPRLRLAGTGYGETALVCRGERTAGWPGAKSRRWKY